jgi:hypothetical protein
VVNVVRMIPKHLARAVPRPDRPSRVEWNFIVLAAEANSA